METPRLIVTAADGSRVELTYDNTLVFLFKGNDDLDHVQLKQGDSYRTNYDPRLVGACLRVGFPVYMRSDRPEFAIERRMKAEPLDFDRLLGDQ